MFQTIHSHDEQFMGLPYPITLVDGAEAEIDDVTGEMVGISIPDMEQLAAFVAVSRILCPLQLHGSEMRFIRRVLGFPSKKFAEALEMDPATYSRWENDKQAIGGWGDKQVRMAALLILTQRYPDLSIDAKAAVGLRIEAREPGQWPSIVVHRRHVEMQDCVEAAGEWELASLALAA